MKHLSICVASRVVFPLTVLLWLSAAAAAAAGPQERMSISLDTSAWQLSGCEFGEGEKAGLASKPGSPFRTITVMVPNDVQLTEFVKDPLGQSPDLVSVNKMEWWYTKEFATPAGAGRMVRLVFDGVDYFADVWLNGVKLGSHEGAYTRFEFDVTDRLSKTGNNFLAVRVTSPWKVAGRSHYEFMKGEYEENWDALPGPGQVVFPLGLHRPVRLELTAPTRIDEVHVWTTGVSEGTAGVRAAVHIVSGGGPSNIAASPIAPSPASQGQSMAGTVEVTLLSENFKGAPLRLPPREFSIDGASKRSVDVDFTAAIGDAHLWWTWDLGAQNLYRAQVLIRDSHGAVIDSTSTIFGIRTLERDSNYQYRLNGRPILSRGANYAMSQLYPASLDRWTYEKDLRLARNAGMNTLLNYTVIGTEDFYNLADQLGILIFEELPFNQEGPIDAVNKEYPRKQAYLNWAAAETGQLVRQLRNHPSIGVWSPVSEVTKNGHDIAVDWDARVVAAADGYREFLKLIEDVVTKEDPQTLYHPSYCDFGEEHYWNGGLRSNSTYDQHRDASTWFVSEYGMMALYPLEDAARVTDLSKLWGPDPQDRSSLRPAFRQKEFSYVHPWQNDGIDMLSSAIASNVTRDVRSLRDYVNASQIYQSFIYQYAGDSYRRKLFNPINGIRSWMFKSFHPLPIGGFGVIDAFDTPLPAYYAQKRTFQPVTLSFAVNYPMESLPGGSTIDVPVWLSNAPQRALSGVVVDYTLYNLKGKVLQSGKLSGAVAGGQAAQVGVASLQLPAEAGVYVLRGHARQHGQDVSQMASASTFLKVSAPATHQALRVLVIGTPDWALPVSDYLRGFGARVTVAVDELTVVRPPHFPATAAEIERDYDVIWLTGYDTYWREAPGSLAPVLLQAVKNGVTFVHTGSLGSYHGGAVKTAALDLTPLAELLPVAVEHQNDLYLTPTFHTGKQLNGLSSQETLHVAATATAPQWLRTLPWDTHAPENFHMLAAKAGSEVLLQLDELPLLVTGRYGKGRTIAYLGFSPRGVPGPDYEPIIVDRAIRESAEGRLFAMVSASLLALASGQPPPMPVAQAIEDRARPLYEQLLAAEPGPAPKVTSRWRTDAEGKAHGHVHIENGKQFNLGLRVRLTGKGVESGQQLPLWSDQYFDLLPNESADAEVVIWSQTGAVAQPVSVVAEGLDGTQTPGSMARAQ